jgi:hypothetical protein
LLVSESYEPVAQPVNDSASNNGIAAAALAYNRRMAVIVHLHTYGTTPEQYEQVRQNAGGRRSVEGFISQMGGPTIDGFCLATVFQTEELADRFVRGRLAVAMEKAGVVADAEIVPTLDLIEDEE